MKILNYEIEDIKSFDHPDYCDAFLSYAEDENGNKLTPEQCLEWQDENSEEFQELIYIYLQ